ncbi:MAG: palindromic element RPE1 domain-containing protein [Candidatus Tisiphia sp.]|jgi:RPE1 domain-containing protein|uniref:palindromic element RPE1 domain-containing protein n=1 Tax=Candidatus Tisiphia endosymbiont of Melanophora roralis TaxID=3066261 RepID=UPI00312CB260
MAKMSYVEEFVGDTERKAAAYSDVRENSSTVSTSESSVKVEFCKMSNELLQLVKGDIDLYGNWVYSKLNLMMEDINGDINNRDELQELQKELLYKAACLSKNTKIMDYLLSSVAIQKDEYDTVLFLAESFSNSEMEKCLLDYAKIRDKTLKQELISGDSKDSSDETISDTLSNVTLTDSEQEQFEEVTTIGDGSEAITNILSV